MAESPRITPSLPNTPPTSTNATQEVSPPSGARFGRFTLQRFHAKGGLGEVHVATDDELGRDVALKRMQPRFHQDADAKRRFLNEAEITARLEHPGIVPVYGLVRDAQEQPCYAMRFIAGESLAEAIKKWHGEPPGSSRRTDGGDQPRRSQDYTALPFRQLVQRFISVCQTMAYAHSKDIIHRDLKPANVMLGPYGETLVVDWGLAKKVGQEPPPGLGESSAVPALDPLQLQRLEQLMQESLAKEHSQPSGDTMDRVPPATPEHDGTEPGVVMGTLGFMSPEQASGRVDLVGPASDVYSLGAMLYELLTGHGPVRTGDIRTMMEQTLTGDIPAPRQSQPAIPRALEAICHKAMALRPADRYASATDLAADLEHWLADAPVSAYAEPWITRARRWMRRHRTVVTGSVVGVVVLLSASLFFVNRNRREIAQEQERTQRQRQEAELAFAKAKEAVDRFYKEVAEDQQLKGTPGLHGLRKRLLEAAVPFFQWFTEQKPTRLRCADQGWAFGRLATLQQELGEDGPALANHQRHRDILAQLVAEYPHEPEYHSDLSGALHNLALVLHDQGNKEDARPKYEEARQLYVEALAQAEQALQAEPASVRYRRFLAKHYHNLGNLLKDMDLGPAAADAYRQARDLRAKLIADFPGVGEYRQELANTYTSQGNLLRELGQLPAAADAYHQALEIRTQLVADFPAMPEFRQELSGDHYNHGKLLEALGQYPAAEAAHRRALALREKLVADFPAVPAYRQQLAMSHTSLGHTLDALRKQPAAADAYRRAVDIQEKLAADFPAVPLYRQDLARNHTTLGLTLRKLGQYPAAEAAYRRAVVLWEKLAADFPGMPTCRQELADTVHDMGHVLKASGQHPAAEAAYRRSLALREKLAADFPATPKCRLDLATSYSSLGNLLAGLGQRSVAEDAYRRAMALLEKLVAEVPANAEYRQDLALNHHNLGLLLENAGQLPAAAVAFRRAAELQEKLVADFPAAPAYRQELAGSSINYGAVIRRQKQAQTSLPWFAKAIALLEPLVQSDAPLATERLFLRNAHWNRAEALVQLGRHADAVTDWNRALELNTEATPTSFLRLGRALSLVHIGGHVQAVAEADALAGAKNPTGARLYNLARVFALATAAVPEDAALREQYAARAVALLRQAVANGYQNLERLRKDEDLKALRQREDFQKLLQEMEKAQP